MADDFALKHPTLGTRPSLFGANPNPDVWSDNGRSIPGDPDLAIYRRTHAEHAADLDDQRRRAQKLAMVLDNLTRCEHGRREGDSCSGPHPRGCNGTSRGNPFAALVGAVMYESAEEGDAVEEEVTDRLAYAAMDGRLVPRQIGFDIEGRPVVVPERGSADDPDAWRVWS